MKPIYSVIMEVIIEADSAEQAEAVAARGMKAFEEVTDPDADEVEVVSITEVFTHKL